MTFRYIRDTYGVPAARGVRVLVNEIPGTITGSSGARIRVKFDSEERARLCHPTWEVEYLTQEEELKPEAVPKRVCGIYVVVKERRHIHVCHRRRMHTEEHQCGEQGCDHIWPRPP